MLVSFFEHYHPFLPFLDPSESPDEYYKTGPSLFWAIIGVGSRRYRDDVTLLTVLSEWVMKVIWAEIAKPPYKLSTVQAIIVFCIWPFPTSTTWDDPLDHSERHCDRHCHASWFTSAVKCTRLLANEAKRY